MTFQENVWSKAWCSSVAIASFPSQRIYLKNQGEMQIYVDSWPPSSLMRNFTHASQNITSGQKKGPNITKKIKTLDITHNISPEQRDRYAAFYHFRYHPNFPREALWKVEQTIMKLRGQRSAWTQRRVRFHRSFQEEIDAAMIWIQKTRMAGLVIRQLEMALCSPQALRCKSYTNASPRIRRRACLGKPRRVDSDIWQLVVSIQVDRLMVGEIKMDLGWGFLGVFSHPRSGDYRVCDGVCTHLLPHAHCCGTVCRTGHPDTLLTRVHTHARLKDVKKVFAVRKSWLSISPSPFWRVTHLLRSFLITSWTPRVSLSY